MIVCNNGSSQTWIDQDLLKNLKLDGEEVTNHLAGIHITSPIQSNFVEATCRPADSTAANNCTFLVNLRRKLAVKKEQYDLRTLTRQCVSFMHSSKRHMLL